MIELFNPNYDRDGNKLSYEITLLPNSTASALPEEIGQYSLVIDIWADPGRDRDPHVS